MATDPDNSSIDSLLRRALTDTKQLEILLAHPEFRNRAIPICCVISGADNSEDLFLETCLTVLEQIDKIKLKTRGTENEFFAWFATVARDLYAAEGKGKSLITGCTKNINGWPDASAEDCSQDLDEFLEHAEDCSYHADLLDIAEQQDEEELRRLFKLARGFDEGGRILEGQKLDAAIAKHERRLRQWKTVIPTMELPFSHIALYNGDLEIASCGRFFDFSKHESINELDTKVGLQVRGVTCGTKKEEVLLGFYPLEGVRHEDKEQLLPLGNGYTIGLKIKTRGKSVFGVHFRCVENKVIEDEDAAKKQFDSRVKKQSDSTEKKVIGAAAGVGGSSDNSPSMAFGTSVRKSNVLRFEPSTPNVATRTLTPPPEDSRSRLTSRKLSGGRPWAKPFTEKSGKVAALVLIGGLALFTQLRDESTPTLMSMGGDAALNSMDKSPSHALYDGASAGARELIILDANSAALKTDLHIPLLSYLGEGTRSGESIAYANFYRHVGHVEVPLSSHGGWTDPVELIYGTNTRVTRFGPRNITGFYLVNPLHSSPVFCNPVTVLRPFEGNTRLGQARTAIEYDSVCEIRDGGHTNPFKLNLALDDGTFVSRSYGESVFGHVKVNVGKRFDSLLLLPEFRDDLQERVLLASPNFGYRAFATELFTGSFNRPATVLSFERIFNGYSKGAPVTPVLLAGPDDFLAGRAFHFPVYKSFELTARGAPGTVAYDRREVQTEKPVLESATFVTRANQVTNVSSKDQNLGDILAGSGPPFVRNVDLDVESPVESTTFGYHFYSGRANSPIAGATNHLRSVSVISSSSTVILGNYEIGEMETCPQTRSSIDLAANVKDPNGDKLLFDWSVTAGMIKGKGRTVSWDLFGVSPGTYTAVVKVSSPGSALTSASTTVTVSTCEPAELLHKRRPTQQLRSRSIDHGIPDE